ncbi:protein kinase domain-containing protein [Streptomyces xanthii]|uniref:Protein kinase n=1 Tax=Streptomyces xanthii TaxID=2768069 RepID=A0A7H1B4V2_9ACTN|nr:serine/threonine-protein kinase [Streptomyces xanthii]QNS03757.1 protein kinase [Streptomyces xanthii]
MKPLGTGDPLRLGPYRLSGVLGEGGMGKVYVGQDSLGTLSAVKVLRPELAHDTNLAQRFVREAQAAQAVRSPGVAAVLGAWTEGGRPWIATEFLAGLTLDQAVDSHGPLPEPAVRALAASLARTLADIHAAGLIHRDLKPPNIVLTSTGPRVIDFGIARPEHGLTLTTTGQVPVTPGYGAPEQALGKRVAPPADVFSLGAVLVYAATGQRAFTGAHVAAVQYAVVHEEPRLDGLSPQLRDLVAPCLAKDPALRPAPDRIAAAMAPSKGAERAWRHGPFADAIKERERSAQQLTTRTTAATSVGIKAPVSRRRLLTGLASGGAVVAAGGAGAWWWSGRGAKTLKPAKNDPFDIPPAVATPVQALDRSIGASGPYGYPSPTALWSASEVVDVNAQRVLPIRDVVVFGSASGGIVAYDVKTGKQRWAAPEVRAGTQFLSLADRLVAAADAEGVVRTYVASTGVPKWTCPEAEADVLLAADDEALYYVAKNGRLRSIGQSDGRVRWSMRAPAAFRDSGSGLSLRCAAGSGRFVTALGDGRVLMLDTADGHVVWSRGTKVDVTVGAAIKGDRLYLNGETMEARRISDGEAIWSTPVGSNIPDGKTWGPPTVRDGALFANQAWFPTRVDARTGKVVWRGRIWQSDESRVVLPQGNGVWSVETNVTDGETTGLSLNTLQASSGGRTWRFDLPETESKDLAAAGNRVFVLSGTNIVVLRAF